MCSVFLKSPHWEEESDHSSGAVAADSSGSRNYSHLARSGELPAIPSHPQPAIPSAADRGQLLRTSDPVRTYLLKRGLPNDVHVLQRAVGDQHDEHEDEAEDDGRGEEEAEREAHRVGQVNDERAAEAEEAQLEGDLVARCSTRNGASAKQRMSGRL